MKTKYKDQTAFNTVDVGVTDGLREVLLGDFPAIDPNDAFLLTKCMISLSNVSMLIGTPPCEATPVSYESIFNWGLNGRQLDEGMSGAKTASTGDIISQSTLLCFSGRCGGLSMPFTEDLRSTFQIGGVQDQIDLTKQTNYGVVRQFPVRQVYLNAEMYEVNPGIGVYSLNVRVDYDVVTLTTGEMSDLYQLLGY